MDINYMIDQDNRRKRRQIVVPKKVDLDWHAEDGFQDKIKKLKASQKKQEKQDKKDGKKDGKGK